MRRDVEEFLRHKIKFALDECTQDQRSLFSRIYPGGVNKVPVDKLETALGLCERTIEKNKKKEKRLNES